MQTEPRYITNTHMVGDLQLSFRGEAWDDKGFVDTEVKCNGNLLCWIVWPDKEKFVQELNAIISKYRI